MKERELRLYANCSLCKKPIGHTGLPLFWRVSVERFGIDMSKVRRQDGLGAFLGNTALARAMGPDEDLTQPMMEKLTLSFCEDCALAPIMLAAIAEMPNVLAPAAAREVKHGD